MNGTIEMASGSPPDPGADLVGLARGGDADAVVALIRRCSARIAAGIEIAGVARHDADHDDAHNQALFEIWQRIDTLRDDDAVCGWMHRIARRTAASRIIDPAIRHRRRAERVAALEPRRTEPGPGEAVARRDLLGAVLGRLSLEHREVLVLRFLEGHSEAETAELLGIGTKTVSSRTTRAKRAALTALDELERDTDETTGTER